MDAGQYTKNITYSKVPDDHGSWGLSLEYLGFKVEGHPRGKGAGDTPRLIFLPKSEGVAAILKHSLGVRGSNSLDVIGSIKGFKVLKND